MLGDLIECPCGCGWGKEQRSGHVRGCKCRSCLGRRNRRAGRAAQRTVHQTLGGTGFSPLHEEARGAYSIELQVESKQGEQIPASFLKFIELEWTRRAIDQAERAIAVGVQAFPAVYVQPARGGRWLIVKL